MHRISYECKRFRDRDPESTNLFVRGQDYFRNVYQTFGIWNDVTRTALFEPFVTLTPKVMSELRSDVPKIILLEQKVSYRLLVGLDS